MPKHINFFQKLIYYFFRVAGEIFLRWKYGPSWLFSKFAVLAEPALAARLANAQEYETLWVIGHKLRWIAAAVGWTETALPWRTGLKHAERPCYSPNASTHRYVHLEMQWSGDLPDQFTRIRDRRAFRWCFHAENICIVCNLFTLLVVSVIFQYVML